MKYRLYSVFDEEFRRYGRVLRGYAFDELFDALAKKPIPEGIFYTPSDADLEGCDVFSELRDRCFGGMPIEIGYVSAHNGILNCLEYHKSSECNLALEPLLLVLGKEEEIRDGKFDASLCRAFLVPARTGVELYGTTLHYAPMHAEKGGYRVACVLPKGTNEAAPATEKKTAQDEWLRGANKWIACFPGTADEADGVYPGLTGENISLAMIGKE